MQYGAGVNIRESLEDLMDMYRGKLIVGETDLTGSYDITLRLPPAALRGMGDGGAGTDYISAAEHAGFKFLSRKAPVLVAAHIDQSTAN
jgi:hypothetical protein